MKAHTSTTQAPVGGSGRVRRRIVPGGILALSLAVALLAATASSASFPPGSTGVAGGTWNGPPPSTPPTTLDQIPEGCLGPPAFNFGYFLVGSTSNLVGMSTSKRFWLGVSGYTFSPSIGVFGEYAQTNNCPPTLSAAAGQIDGCLITVTFTPTGEHKGFRFGTLSTGPGGPTMALRGYGEPRDSVPPDLKLSGPKRQNPQKDPFFSDGPRDCDGIACAVVVRVSCGDDWCTARVRGRLTNVKNDNLKPDGRRDVNPGHTTRCWGPSLTYSQRRQVQRALRRGETVKAKVTVRARDLSGNVATAKRTIRLVKFVATSGPNCSPK